MTNPEDYSATVTALGDDMEVAVKGELDVYTASMLRHTLNELIAEGHRSLVIEMANLSYIDSTGLGVLVGALKQVRELGGDLRLRGLTAQAYNVFEITGLTRVFTIER